MRQVVARFLRCCLMVVLATAVAGPLAPADTLLGQGTGVVWVAPFDSPSGASVTIGGSGFPAETELSALTFGRASALPEPVPVTDRSGSFRAWVTVPDSPDGGSLAPGPVILRVVVGNVVGRTSFAIPTPSISLSSGTVWPGQALTITGTGFRANSHVDTVDIGQQNQAPRPSPATDFQGAFTTNVTLPDLNPGAYTVTVSTANLTATAPIKIVSTPGEPTAPSPPEDAFRELRSRGLLVMSAVAPQGETTFGAYVPDLPGDSLPFVVPHSTLALTLTKDTLVSVSGRRAVLVPAHETTFFSVGSVVSVQVGSEVDDQAAQTTTRRATGVVRLSPPSAVAGQVVMVSGTGFPAETALSALNFGEVDVLPDPTPVTDASGNFIVRMTVPSSREDGFSAPGMVVVTAEAGNILGTMPLTMTVPRIALSSDEALPGDVLTITGEGFLPNADVDTFDFGWANQAPIPARMTDDEGAFRATVSVPAVNPGTYTIRVRTGPKVTATTPIRILSGYINGGVVPQVVFRPLTARGLLVLAAAPSNGTRFGAYVPDFPGNTLTVLKPLGKLVLTLTRDTLVSVSGRPAVLVSAHTPTLLTFGLSVSLEVED